MVWNSDFDYPKAIQFQYDVNSSILHVVQSISETPSMNQLRIV